jgi:hypothetical protein
MHVGGKSRWLISGTAILLVAGGIYTLYELKYTPHVKIPKAVTQSASFPIYTPKKLPEGFSLDQNSFQYISGEGVLVFQATDKAGDKLVFSEQPKPANFNFDDFNNKQLISPKPLPNTPYATTVGKTLDKQTTLISILTDKTWIIATTQTELNNQQLLDISASLHKY